MPPVPQKLARISADPARVRRNLLAWYDRHARTLAWRIGPAERRAGARPDPYAVWLSEVMLQQTGVVHAAPYYRSFLERWPRVEDLAAEADEAVMAAWAGLGYYARARNLLRCARAVAGEHGGVFPDNEAGLLSLPGVGAYTAAAVAAIAFDRAANVVDGNVERVVSRLFAVEAPLPTAKPELMRLAATLVADDRPGDWAQALMALGSGPCRPKAPLCLICPINEDCRAFATGAPERYPRKLAKAAKPHRLGAVFVQRRGDEVAVVTRPSKGLLGGMIGLPTSDWGGERPASPGGAWREAGAVDHVFTHFSLELRVWVAEADVLPEGARWMSAAAAASALPTVFKKAMIRGLAAADEGEGVRRACA